MGDTLWQRFRCSDEYPLKNRPWQGPDGFGRYLAECVNMSITFLTGFAFKAVRRKESAGDLWGLSLTEGGGRSRDGKIRPGLSRFANGQDNSGAGGRGNTAQRFALERIGQSAVCIYLKKTGFLYSDI